MVLECHRRKDLCFGGWVLKSKTTTTTTEENTTCPQSETLSENHKIHTLFEPKYPVEPPKPVGLAGSAHDHQSHMNAASEGKEEASVDIVTEKTCPTHSADNTQAVQQHVIFFFCCCCCCCCVSFGAMSTQHHEKSNTNPNTHAQQIDGFVLAILKTSRRLQDLEDFKMAKLTLQDQDTMS